MLGYTDWYTNQKLRMENNLSERPDKIRKKRSIKLKKEQTK